jgi:hypothetical protein
MVEVVIVLAIIICLFAFMMPVITRAREQSKRVQCIANVKQLTIAWLAYAADNDRKTCGCDGRFKPDPPWIGVAAGDVAAGKRGIQAGALWPYLNNENVYKCSNDLTINRFKTSYQMNSGLPIGTKLDNLTDPAHLFVFIEGCNTLNIVLSGSFPAPSWPAVTFGQYVPGENHRINSSVAGGTPISFADGHAIFYQYVDARTGYLHEAAGTPVWTGDRNSPDLFQLEAWSGGPIPPGATP